VKKMSGNKLKSAILGRANAAITRDIEDTGDYKSVTVRLTISDYAKLKVLSTYLDDSPSGVAKVILTEGINDALDILPESGYNVDLGRLFTEVQKEQSLLCEESLS
jgi:hypothetical protein